MGPRLILNPETELMFNSHFLTRKGLPFSQPTPIRASLALLNRSRSQFFLGSVNKVTVQKQWLSSHMCPHPFAFFPSVPRAAWEMIFILGMIKGSLHWSLGLCLAEKLKAGSGRHADMLQHIQERRVLGWKTLNWPVSSWAQNMFQNFLIRMCRNRAIFNSVWHTNTFNRSKYGVGNLLIDLFVLGGGEDLVLMF